MAIYGLQIDFINTILKERFGLSEPLINGNEIYIGLGLGQNGALANTNDFTEVFSGRPFGNYRRSRAIFGHANNAIICNINEIVFNTASEDWTTSKSKVEMLGLFNTIEYEDNEKNLIKPLVVLRLPQPEVVLKGETIALSPNAVQLSFSDF